jgi:hypothetical protein
MLTTEQQVCTYNCCLSNSLLFKALRQREHGLLQLAQTYVADSLHRVHHINRQLEALGHMH